jgi:hypothetical protein
MIIVATVAVSISTNGSAPGVKVELPRHLEFQKFCPVFVEFEISSQQKRWQPKGVIGGVVLVSLCVG